jgi:hypothetical protein
MRAVSFVRSGMLVRDVGRLHDVAAKASKFQIIDAGKELIQRIVQKRDALKPAILLVHLENYDIEMTKLFTAGVDVWLNTAQPRSKPRRPAVSRPRSTACARHLPLRKAGTKHPYPLPPEQRRIH